MTGMPGFCDKALCPAFREITGDKVTHGFVPDAPSDPATEISGLADKPLTLNHDSME